MLLVRRPLPLLRLELRLGDHHVETGEEHVRVLLDELIRLERVVVPDYGFNKDTSIVLLIIPEQHAYFALLALGQVGLLRGE